MATTPEPASPQTPLAPAELAEGEMELLGLLQGSSNYTFLAKLGSDERLVVYKPRRGETPLWDFPTGTLCQREAAAYVICSAAGWGYVPPTILRDGPHGPGMVQQFIDHDPTFNAFNLAPDYVAELKEIALLDLIINNADRKAGHVLRDPGGRLWAIDHGVCFHVEPKLRTVLWDFIEEPVPDESLRGIENLREAISGELAGVLSELLFPEEVVTLHQRAEVILRDRVFPAPGPGRPYPWPPI